MKAIHSTGYLPWRAGGGCAAALNNESLETKNTQYHESAWRTGWVSIGFHGKTVSFRGRNEKVLRLDNLKLSQE